MIKKEKSTKEANLYSDNSKGEVYLRHKLVAETLGKKIKDSFLVDIGCGKGLILDTLHDYDCKPSRYVGTDILDKSAFIYNRVELGYDIKECSFYQCEKGVPSFVDELNADVAICIGVAGLQGMHTYAQNVELIRNMQLIAPHGLVFYPKAYDLTKTWDAHLIRFDLDDMLYMLYTARHPECINLRYIELEKEFVIHW